MWFSTIYGRRHGALAGVSCGGARHVDARQRHGQGISLPAARGVHARLLYGGLCARLRRGGIHFHHQQGEEDDGSAHHQVDGKRLISQQHREDAAQQSLAAEDHSRPGRRGMLLGIGLGKEGKGSAEQSHIEDGHPAGSKIRLGDLGQFKGEGIEPAQTAGGEHLQEGELFHLDASGNPAQVGDVQ